MHHYLIIFFLLLAQQVFGQSYRFENFNSHDGLAQSQVNTMIQDEKGYLWVGTVVGLSRYDSHEFINYYKKDGLLDNNIVSLYEHEDRQLWVGTKGGISLKKSRKFVSFKFPENKSEFKVLNITSLDQNTLLLATNGCGMVQFNIAQKTFLFNDEHKEYIRKIILIGDLFFLATPEGLFTVPESDITNMKYSVKLFLPEFKNMSITDIESQGDKIWISTFKKGVYLFSENKLAHFTQEDGLIGNWIKDIAISDNNNIWFATGLGVSCYTDNRFINFDESNGLNNSSFKHIMNDRNGNIWLGSNGGGLFRFSGWLFTTWTKQDNLPSDIIMTITEDHEDRVWLGSFGEGFAYMDKNDSIVRVSDKEIGFTWSSAVTRENEIWFGTNSGIVVYDNGKIRNLKDEGEFDGTKITALYEDNGILWIGHKRGLSSYDGVKFTSYGQSLGVPMKRVRSIAKKGETLWVAGGNGLFSFNGTIITRWDESHGLTDNNLNTIAFDDKGRLWIGTRSGLNVMEKDIIRPVDIKSKENDPVNFLYSFENRLLVGTNFGIHELSLDQDIDFDNPNIRHYNLASGLPDLDCNLNAINQVDEDEILFGTANGLVSMNLEILRGLRNSSTPYVNITGIRIFMRDKDLSEFSSGIDSINGLYKHLELKHTDNHITFDFTAISYSSSDEVKYQYRLVGADAEWLPPTKSNFATYSYLPYGDYTFELKVADENSTWTFVPIRYSFTIKPPYYLTPWFILLWVAMMIGALWLLYRWRKSIRKKERETELIIMQSKLMDLEQQSLNSSMNRHFIFNALNSIQYYINREDKRSANMYLTNFAKLIRKNLDSTENKWTTLHDELERIELYLSMEHMRFKDRFEYKINISKDIDVHQIVIPPMLFQPFLENSIWHGILPKEENGLVTLNIDKSNNQVRITITDDGIGISQSKVNKNGQLEHDSKGVEIINSRIILFSKMTNKEFQITGPKDIFDKNKNCVGTTVEILMPIVRNTILKT